jgi:hypothetical protein
MIMSMAVPVSVAVPAIMFVAIVVIPVSITIPVVVVLNPTSVPVPVTDEISAAFVVRPDPIGSFIGRHCPVALMPPVMVPDRIPVTFHPYEIWSGRLRLDVYTRRRWRSNHDSNRNLCPNR